MNELAYEQALTQKIDDLMNVEYSPFDPDNLRECLAQMDDDDYKKMAAMLKFSPTTGGQFLTSRSVKFWTGMAKTEAEARLEDECQNCFGLGCNQCDEQRLIDQKHGE